MPGRCLLPLVMLLLLAPLVSACPDASWVPGVAVGAATSKCMKITEPSTHEGCAAACGPSASLACIQSEADNALADALSFHRWELEPHYLWTGEIQYPFEPVIEFRLRGDFQISQYLRGVNLPPFRGLTTLPTLCRPPGS